MSFQFRLESLLRHRRRVEQDEIIKLRALSHCVSAAQDAVQSSKQSQERFQVEHLSRMTQGMNGAELRFARECQSALQRAGEAAERALAEAKNNFENQRKVLIRERQAREVLENIRQHEYSRYQLEENRRQQRLVDDLILMRRAREKG